MAYSHLKAVVLKSGKDYVVGRDGNCPFPDRGKTKVLALQLCDSAFITVSFENGESLGFPVDQTKQFFFMTDKEQNDFCFGYGPYPWLELVERVETELNKGKRPRRG